MCTKSFKFPLKTLLATVLVCALPMGMLHAAPNCQTVPLTVVNSSNQDLSIRGSQGTIVVPANSTTQVAFQSNHFYSKCGLIEVGFNDQSFQRGLIANTANAVNIHVQPNGNVEQVGLTDQGFKLDEYISWWGLGAVLG